MSKKKRATFYFLPESLRLSAMRILCVFDPKSKAVVIRVDVITPVSKETPGLGLTGGTLSDRAQTRLSMKPFYLLRCRPAEIKSTFFLK